MSPSHPSRLPSSPSRMCSCADHLVQEMLRVMRLMRGLAAVGPDLRADPSLALGVVKLAEFHRILAGMIARSCGEDAEGDLLGLSPSLLQIGEDKRRRLLHALPPDLRARVRIAGEDRTPSECDAWNDAERLFRAGGDTHLGGHPLPLSDAQAKQLASRLQVRVRSTSSFDDLWTWP